MSRRSGSGASRATLGAYLASLVLTVTIACHGALGLFNHFVSATDEFLAAPKAKAAPATLQRASFQLKREPAVASRGQVVLTQGWADRILSEIFGGGRGGSRDRSERTDTSRGNARDDGRRWSNEAEPSDDEPTYRTVCVRLCDGYFWPVSFATTEAHFGQDRAQCERGCGTPAKLYVYRNPGGEPGDMKDLDGKPYSHLPTANLFRTKYEAACTCKAHPWEQEAKDRHRLYALDAARRNGNKVAAREAEQLKARMETERRAKVLALKQPQKQPANAPIISAAIVAATGAAVVQGNRTLEAMPSASGPAMTAPVRVMPVVINPPKPKSPPRQAAASGNARPAGIMRAGASSRSNSGGGGSGGGSSSRGSGSSGAGSSNSGGDWRNTAFRGN